MTYSVGQVRVADLVATYYGTQRLTPDNQRRSRLRRLRSRGRARRLRRAAGARPARGRPACRSAQARAYDAAALERLSGDVPVPPQLRRRRRAWTRAASGARGVLEQSWRIGGASGAEIAALEAFRADPSAAGRARLDGRDLRRQPSRPPHATVYFRGVDDEVGPITKYALVEPHDDA